MIISVLCSQTYHYRPHSIVKKIAMFLSRSCMPLGFSMLAERVVVRGLMMMMRGGVMVSGR